MARAHVACALLPLAVLAAASARSYAQQAAPAFDAAVCSGGSALAADVADSCRADFRARIEADRARVELWREEQRLAHEESVRQRRERGQNRVAPLDLFLLEPLDYGDVVVTDKGPLVYVGRDGGTPRREDFVPVDSPRSPRRADARRLKDATRPR